MNNTTVIVRLERDFDIEFEMNIWLKITPTIHDRLHEQNIKHIHEGGHVLTVRLE
jgi:hypothetical protein